MSDFYTNKACPFLKFSCRKDCALYVKSEISTETGECAFYAIGSMLYHIHERLGDVYEAVKHIG